MDIAGYKMDYDSVHNGVGTSFFDYKEVPFM